MRANPSMSPEQSTRSWNLIEQNLKLIQYVVRRNTHPKTNDELDEHVQSAILFIHSRLHMHDERAGLSTYMGHLARWCVLNACARARYKANGMDTISIDGPAKEGSDFTLERFLADDRMDVESSVIDDSRDDAVRKALDVLDDRERHIVEGVYWHGKTITDATSELGLHPRYGTSIHDLALRKIRWAYREATK